MRRALAVSQELWNFLAGKYRLLALTMAISHKSDRCRVGLPLRAVTADVRRVRGKEEEHYQLGSGWFLDRRVRPNQNQAQRRQVVEHRSARKARRTASY